LLRWPKEKIAARVDELLELVNLDPNEFRNRWPVQLSGGQQQRIGLARALAADPPVMLLDEPFGAIDAITRRDLQDELINIHHKNQKTYLFVTHDINEALRLGTRILVMHEGRIQQFDVPDQILHHPANDFVKSLMEARE
jgi:osmoprotectant transport system ATP-binding protein